jgi:hypothetical protein
MLDVCVLEHVLVKDPLDVCHVASGEGPKATSRQEDKDDLFERSTDGERDDNVRDKELVDVDNNNQLLLREKIQIVVGQARVVEDNKEEGRVMLQDEEQHVTNTMVGPVLEEVRQPNGLLDAGPRLPNFSENESVSDIILKKRGAAKAKKPKKGSTSLGAPRCMALKELAVNGKKGRGKEGGEGGVKKSKGGESTKEGCATIVGEELEVVLPSC